jgi:hypothetical protein
MNSGTQAESGKKIRKESAAERWNIICATFYSSTWCSIPVFFAQYYYAQTPVR